MKPLQFTTRRMIGSRTVEFPDQTRHRTGCGHVKAEPHQLDAAARARALRVAAQHVAAIRLPGREFVQRVLEDAARAQSAGVVFQRVEANLWAIHCHGEAQLIVECELVGLRAAWHAIDAGASGVRVAEFAREGARQGGNMLRRAIRETAVQWIERSTGCTELAAAMTRIHVGRDGRIVYRNGAGSSPIITR